MITITDIAYTGYPVTNVARARSFYEGLLGLKVATTFGEDGAEWIEYEIGGGTLAITNLSPEQWKPSKDGPGIAFEVADFSAAVSALRAGGATFYSEPMESPGCRLVVVADPDGNSVVLHQRNAPAA